MRADGGDEHDLVQRREAADTMDYQGIKNVPTRFRFGDDFFQRALGHAGVVFERHPGHRRVVARDFVQIAHRAGESRDRADLRVARTLRGAQGIDLARQVEVFGLHPHWHRRVLRSTAGDGWKECNLVARLHFGLRIHQVLIHCCTQIALGRELFGPDAAARCQVDAQSANRRDIRRQGEGLGRGADRFAQTGKKFELQVHFINSANGRKRRVSPRRIACPAGLSINPSPHTADVRTPEL